MNRPSCFQVTNSAITGIAAFALTSHDGDGASGPRISFTSPPELNRKSQTATSATLAVT